MEGILAEILSIMGVPARVQQRECARQGAKACVYALSAPVFDERWTGKPDTSHP